MKEEEIIEGNLLVAKFMELWESEEGYLYYIYDEKSYRFDNLKFHSDWNWLMNVIKKISIISNNNFDADVILRRWDKYHFLWVEINRVWIDCISIIKWYNTQTNNNSSHQEE